MAGVEFKKLGGGALAEMAGHFDNEIRSDKRVNHSNKTINIEMTHLNYYLGGNSYQDICEKLEKIVTDTDEKNPPLRIRQDRKVYFSLEIPCPPDLEGTDQEDIFYEKTFEMYKKMIPGLVGGVIHKDEKHEYYDFKKKELCTSRNHAHYFGACLTKDERINAHNCINKILCQEVNNSIQKLCLEEWGFSFQTGEQRCGEKKTVEELKQESQIALQAKLAKENIEIIPKMKEEKAVLTDEIETLQLYKEQNEQTVAELEKKVYKKQVEVAILNKKANKLNEEVAEKKSLIEKLDDALANIFTRFNKAYIQVTKIFDHWEEVDETIHSEVLKKARPCVIQGKKSMDELYDNSINFTFGEKATTPKIKNNIDNAVENLLDATVTLESLNSTYAFEEEDDFDR